MPQIKIVLLLVFIAFNSPTVLAQRTAVPGISPETTGIEIISCDSFENHQTELCGDSVIQACLGEKCDDGNANDNDDCTNACTNPYCGDSIAWNQGNGQEECDDGNEVAGDGCDGCFFEPPDPGDLTDEEICYWASIFDDFLDQLQTADDGRVFFCHLLNTDVYDFLDNSLSACLMHLGHPGDLFPTTVCDS